MLLSAGYLREWPTDLVIYTVSAGDEPRSGNGTYRFAKTLGFKVVYWQGENNPVNFFATQMMFGEALRKGMNPKILLCLRRWY